MSSDYFLNKHLNPKEESFVRDLNHTVLLRSDDELTEFLNKEINKDKLYLICEMVNVGSNDDPRNYTNSLFSAMKYGKMESVKLLAEKYKQSVKPTPVPAPATATAPEQTTGFKMPLFNISNPFERKKTEGGRRRTRKSRKQRKSRK